VSLVDARLYLVAPARIAAGDVAKLLPDLAAAGVDVFQLREAKDREAGDVIADGARIMEACRSAGLPFIVNDRPDIAVALGADGVHVGQNDVPPQVARRLVGSSIVGLSTHSTREVDEAVALGDVLDYIAVGPVNPTPTKPGRPGTGFELVSYAARRIPEDKPWFVTGGMSAETIPALLAAGGTRAVVVRAIAEAPDPVAATREIAAALNRNLHAHP